MIREITFNNYPLFVSDLRRTLSLRFGLKLKPNQVIRDFDGITKVRAEMSDEQYVKIVSWRDSQK